MKFNAAASIKIVLLGAGGTGSYILQNLYRLAYASGRDIRIIVCDGDIVEEHNLIRQNFIAQDIGENKAKVLCERYSSAFGIATEYVPEYIESEEVLSKLLTFNYNSDINILIGAVDNNSSRQICHRVFQNKPNLIYLDSGNSEYTGQVVCGVRKNARTIYKPVGGIYPDILETADKLPSELSCAERSISEPQTIMANLTAANTVLSFLYSIIVRGRLDTRYVTFSSKLMSMRPTQIIHPTNLRRSA